MLGQSNPTQTRQSLPSLDFGDRDLTDAFVDVRDGTHSSISGFGHPRGSTPISALSSRRSTPSTAFSAETSESRRTLPNMSALLDFLDTDNTNPFPSRSHSSRKPKPPGSHQSSCSPRSIATIPHQSTSVTPRHMAADLDLTSNFVSTFNNHTDRFRTALPTSSTPFAQHHEDFTPDELSESSSPLNKRHVLPAVMKPSLPSLRFSEQVASRQPVQAGPSGDEPHDRQPGPRSQRSDRSSSALPLETPAPTPFKGPSEVDRMAAALMEGAESHWTYCVDNDAAVNRAGIRRSKVVEELLQPMRPSLSCPGGHASPAPDTSRSTKDNDLPQSLIEETRRSFHVPPPPIVPSASSDSIRHSRLTKSAGYSPSPNLLRPTPKRPSTLAPASSSQDPDCTNPSTTNEQVEVLDARVNQLLSHIRSDQLEKANLVAALAEARGEVASLRDEVRLLRIGVQKLGEGRSYQSADARLERRRPSMMARSNVDEDKDEIRSDGHQPLPSSSRYQRESLELWLTENTLPPTSAKPSGLSPKPPHHRPPSRANLLNEPIEGSPKTRQQVPPVQPTLNQEARFEKDGNEEEDMMTEFADVRNGAGASMMADLTRQFLGDLALGLSFTRHVDQLLMNPMAAQAGPSADPPAKFRPDSEIFSPVNLDRHVCRLRVWKQIVRCQSSHPPPSHTHLPSAKNHP